MSVTKEEKFFTNRLLKWSRLKNKREMPWKGEKDPYKIWLSEIILQQTRVEQGMPYYNRFIEKYPTIKKLALADEKDIFKLWEGLGYYTRCRNLIATAKYIADKCSGNFPEDYASILDLKGIGPYTAAAIGSFAFNLPYAVVDGNVMRVLARYFGIKTATDSTEGKKMFSALANKLLDRKNAGGYNQAIMDFGATICKPRLPLCVVCPLSANCMAFQTRAVNEYPVKVKKLVKKSRWFYYIVAEYGSNFFVRKREGKDIWQNLHEFILIEEKNEMRPEELLTSTEFKKIAGAKFKLVTVSEIYKQELTHQTIRGRFIYIRLKKLNAIKGYQPETKQNMLKLAFPGFITRFFLEKDNFLSYNG